jgi:hypothetical protein
VNQNKETDASSSKDQLEDMREKFLAWISKINTFKKEIKALEDLQDNPIINASALSIGVFLLKVQIIEFELKQTIPTLDRVINHELLKNQFQILRKIRYPKDLNDMTLGKIVNLFCEFEGLIPDGLKKDLKKLNDLRNDFTHNLFSQTKSIEDMNKEACSGIKLSDMVLEYLANLNKAVNEKMEKEINAK